MNKEKLLKKLRKERPDQVIHEVISFDKNDYGFYNVKVDMESMFFDTKVIHTKTTLPYPMSKYEKLTESQQFDWRFENM